MCKVGIITKRKYKKRQQRPNKLKSGMSTFSIGLSKGTLGGGCQVFTLVRE